MTVSKRDGLGSALYRGVGRSLQNTISRNAYQLERKPSNFINPRRACVRVTVVVLCVCVCVCPFSLFCLLALLGVQREVSAATARKMQ